jgi:hypothetical protein
MASASGSPARKAINGDRLGVAGQGVPPSAVAGLAKLTGRGALC